MHTSSRPSSLFRESALKKLQGSQPSFASLEVIEPQTILYILAIIISLMGLAVWSAFAYIEVDVDARGVMLEGEKIKAAEKKYQANHQAREQILQSQLKLLSQKQILYEKHYITIDELEKAKLNYLNAEESLATTPKLINQPLDNLFLTQKENSRDLQAIAFVNAGNGKKIKAGMKVYLLPTTMSVYEHGYIKGEVSDISQYPVSKEIAYAYLGNMNVVDDYFTSGAPFVIKINIAKNNHDGGLSWTRTHDPKPDISEGSATTVRVVTQQYHPYELLLRR